MAKQTPQKRIDLVKVRERLPKDKGPFWRRVRKTLHVGYRPSSGAWLGRAYIDRKLLYKSIGMEADLSYDEACEKAVQWFQTLGGGAPHRYDVLDAITQYAETKGVKQYIHGHVFTREQAQALGDLSTLTKHATPQLLALEVAELRTLDLERWRDSIEVKPASRRRVFTILAAALSNAHRVLGVGKLEAWRRVKATKIPKAERSRVFIPTDAEVESVLKKSDPDFALLVRAGVHTGCRYGELTELEVRDFDPARGTLSLRVSKTGSRDVLLSSTAVKFFKERVKGKTPMARVFTTADGGPWMKSMQHRRLRSATTIRAFVFYSLRHYALSKQLSAGIPSALVAKNAGTSEQILKQHYHKIVPADRSLFDRVSVLGSAA